MARVQTADVKVLIDTELNDLSVFIQSATLQVDRIAAKGLLSTNELKEIERWLSAHFASIRDKRTVKDAVGDSSHTYEGKTGMGLNFTRYGQQALLLDTTGTLAESGKRRATISYLGGTVNASGEVEV